MDSLGKTIMCLGAFLFLAGGSIWLGARIGWLPLGRLPGDVVVHRSSFSFYFPIVTCLVLSVVGSLILWLLGALRR